MTLAWYALLMLLYLGIAALGSLFIGAFFAFEVPGTEEETR